MLSQLTGVLFLQGVMTKCGALSPARPRQWPVPSRSALGLQPLGGTRCSPRLPVGHLHGLVVNKRGGAQHPPRGLASLSRCGGSGAASIQPFSKCTLGRSRLTSVQGPRLHPQLCRRPAARSWTSPSPAVSRFPHLLHHLFDLHLSRRVGLWKVRRGQVWGSCFGRVKVFLGFELGSSAL